MTAARTCLTIALLAASLATAPATAQTKPDSETFLEAIEEQKNNEVVDLVGKKGRSIINWVRTAFIALSMDRAPRFA